MHQKDLQGEEHKAHHHTLHHKQENQTSRFLLLAIPFLVVLTLLTVAVSIYKKDEIVQQYPIEEDVWDDDDDTLKQYPVEPQSLDQASVAVPDGYQIVDLSEEEQQRLYDQIRIQAPINPTQVSARSGSDPQAQELLTDVPYSYPNPVFTWSGEGVKEPGVNVTGYMVYFGSSHFSPDFLQEAQYQTSNTYTATGLQPGTTYYLMVRVVTDSSTLNQKYGFDQEGDGRPVRPIFVYNYNVN